MPAARLHVLTALASPLALVLRRGPVGRVASLLWNRDTGEVTLGQWLAGRIHEYRADISPDGRHWVYFASKPGRPGGPTGWTALARTPWLGALAFLGQDSTWGGGGAFTADGALWSPLPAPLPDGLRKAAPEAFPPSTDGVFAGDTQGARLRLRGWRHVSGESHGAIHARDLPGGGVLDHRYALHAANRAILSSRYRLTLPGRAPQPKDWEWADLWQGRLFFARAGCLWAERPGAAELIHDFNAMTFTPRPAPPGAAP